MRKKTDFVLEMLIQYICSILRTHMRLSVRLQAFEGWSKLKRC